MNVKKLLVLASAGILATFSAAHARPAAAPPSVRALDLAAVHARGAARAAADTFWFGGTHWDAAQARWEANVSASRTNRWTFDSGVGGNSEGWTGDDKTLLPPPTCPRPPLGTPDNSDFRWTNSVLYANYGTPATSIFPTATPADNGGIWCSKYDVETDELCWPSQGYGSFWNHEARKTFAYGGAGDARITFRYFNNTEKSYDFTYLYLEFNGVRESAPRLTMTYTLGAPGSKRLKTVTVSAASIPAGTTSIAAVFKFTSDQAFSSGISDYLGAFCCYNFLYEDAGTPGNTDEDTFEAGPDGWQFFQPLGVGDFVRVADLGSLTPPSVSCPVLGGNVLVMSRAAGPPRHPDNQDNFAVSPVIDLDEFGLGNAPVKLVIADAFMDLPLSNAVYYTLRLKQYPVYCAVTGQNIEDYMGPDGWLSCTPAPTCYRDAVFQDFGTTAADIDYCRIAIEVLNLCSTSTTCTGPAGGNETPYWDNVAFAVTENAVVGEDAAEAPMVSALDISPNPFNPLVKLSYAVASPGRVVLRIYDVRGALVMTLVDQTKAAGRYEALWNGMNDAGQRVPSGVFWARYETPGSGIVKQLVLLK